MVRQPDVHVSRAVGEGGVGRAVLTIHRHVQRTLRRVGLRILECRRQRAGHEHHQPLVVSEPVERQVGDLGRLELRMNVRLVGLQQLGCRLDRDALAQRADLQREIDTADLAGGDRHAGSHDFAEPLECDLDVVRPGEDVRERVRALRISRRFTCEVGVGVDDRHLRPGNDRTVRVGDRSHEPAIKKLRRRGRRRDSHDEADAQ